MATAGPYYYNDPTTDQTGLSQDQINQLLANYPPVQASQPTGQYGGSSPGAYGMSPQFNQGVQLLQAANQGGGGPTNQQQQQGYVQGNPSGVDNPLFAASRLGAAALGQPMVINSMPNQGQMSKGGIYTGAQLPTVYGTSAPAAPAGPWNTVAGPMTSQTQAQGTRAYQQAGGNPNYTLSPAEAQGFAQYGQLVGTAPSYNPSPTAGGTPTPTPVYGGVTGAAAPAAQPWARAPMPQVPTAQPPAAPTGAGLVPGLPMAVHTSALADAGKALYAHFGGDPNSASPSDIADFHSQLVGAVKGGPPIKMRSGGLVPGKGNTDSVPALLTPGEYVVPKDQVPQLFGGRPPVRMADGGLVPDDSNQPPEARRKPLTVPNPQRGVSPQQQQPSQSSGSTSAQSSGAAPTSFSDSIQNLVNLRNQRQAESQGQPIGGTGYSPTAGGYVGISPDTGTSGYIYPTQAAATAGGATGQGAIGMGPNMSQMSGAIGGLASGLAAAADKYRQSVGSWQIQQSSPMMYAGANQPPPPPIQLGQPPSPQGQPQRQQTNPYMAALMAANPSAYYANMA